MCDGQPKQCMHPWGTGVRFGLLWDFMSFPARGFTTSWDPARDDRTEGEITRAKQGIARVGDWYGAAANIDTTLTLSLKRPALVDEPCDALLLPARQMPPNIHLRAVPQRPAAEVAKSLGTGRGAPSPEAQRIEAKEPGAGQTRDGPPSTPEPEHERKGVWRPRAPWPAGTGSGSPAVATRNPAVRE